jgi:pimeloyl-ACP methyl ester carboxylesterase
MAKQRPDIFSALVGTGQVSDLPQSVAMEYARLLTEARRANDASTLQALERIGPPPFKNLQQVGAYFEQAGKYQPAADTAAMDAIKQSLLSPPPDYSLSDVMNQFRGFTAVPTWSLYEELLSSDLNTLGPEFQVPVFFIEGSEDRITSPVLAEAYFNAIKAPHKEWVILPKGGHFAVWSQSRDFLRELVARVRPFAG